VIATFLFISPAYLSAESATAALPYFGLSSGNKAQTVAIRSYKWEKTLFLAVNTTDLSTRLIAADSCNFKSVSRQTFDSAIANTVYGRALKDALRRNSPLQDAGIERTTPAIRGIDLTVDLCPSHRPLERTFFTQLIGTFSAEEKPIPVALAITGVWMKEHPEDLGWLLDFVSKGDLSITWINHSFSHRFDPKLPLCDNFLLEKGTNLRNEILNNELAMLEHSITPSVFFRFPGLVSDSAVFDSVVTYGLIPIGSDAWLAKGQHPSSGSIVLVHGNGNEPVGITKFFELIAQRKPEIRERKWLLFDLRESLASEEKGK
jgi:hypothetical protein